MLSRDQVLHVARLARLELTEAERERRAKVIHAEGEFQASRRLHDAAEVISRNPAALQLRYLQTLAEVGVNQNSTIVFPLPLDVVRPFLEAAGNGDSKDRHAGTEPAAGADGEAPRTLVAGVGEAVVPGTDLRVPQP